MYRLLLLALLIVAGCSPSVATYPASDERIQVMGRHLIGDDGAIDFGAAGVTFVTRFRGPRLEAQLEDEFRDSTSYNWFTVIVDDGEPSRFRTEPGRRWYTLADSLPPGEHTVMLSKATEGQNGHNRLVEVRARELLQADPLPERRIEFIGNSITSGYGLDARQVGCDEGTWFDQTHAWLAYGPRLARRLGAQWMLTSVSGMGMHRNWNSPGPVMPDVYEGVYAEYTEDVTPWDFSRYTPDLVVIALGTNDFSAGDGATPRPVLDGASFVNDYTAFVGLIRQRYPDALLVLVNSPVFGPDDRDQLGDYLQQVADRRAAAGDSTISTFAYSGRYASGCDGHPDLDEHVAMADEFEPALRRATGW